MFKVRISSRTGHEDGEPVEDEDSPEVLSFDTEAERAAFLLGVNLANEAGSGWINGYLDVESC